LPGTSTLPQGSVRNLLEIGSQGADNVLMTCRRTFWKALATVQSPGRLTVLKHMLDRVKELLNEARDLRYVSVPLWRPWRDF
jgi:hypothetical protein